MCDASEVDWMVGGNTNICRLIVKALWVLDTVAPDISKVQAFDQFSHNLRNVMGSCMDCKLKRFQRLGTQPPNSITTAVERAHLAIIFRCCSGEIKGWMSTCWRVC